MAYTYTLAGELDKMSGGLNDGTMPLAPYFYKAGTHTPQGTLWEQYGNGLYGNSVYDAVGHLQGKWVCANTINTSCTGGTNLNGYVNFITGDRVTRQVDVEGDRTYGYDDVGRLSSLVGTDGARMNWLYDVFGNRYSQTASGIPSAPQPQFGIDPATNRIQATGYSYDAAGNMLTDSIHSYTYDQEGNVVQVDAGNTATDYYDAQNRRVAHGTPSLFQRYEYNNEGRISDIWYNEEQYERTSRYYANGRNFAYWSSGGNLANARLHFQHADTLGTVRFRSTSTGAAEGTYYSLPFGDGYSHSGTDDNVEHFAELDRDPESDTQQATFRKLSSSTGRWLSPDPYDGSYDPTNPQSLNRYNTH